MNFDLELAEQLVYLYKKLCSIDDYYKEALAEQSDNQSVKNKSSLKR